MKYIDASLLARVLIDLRYRFNLTARFSFAKHLSVRLTLATQRFSLCYL
jgi:hypothetical protein